MKAVTERAPRDAPRAAAARQAEARRGLAWGLVQQRRAEAQRDLAMKLIVTLQALRRGQLLRRALARVSPAGGRRAAAAFVAAAAVSPSRKNELAIRLIVTLQVGASSSSVQFVSANPKQRA